MSEDMLFILFQIKFETIHSYAGYFSLDAHYCPIGIFDKETLWSMPLHGSGYALAYSFFEKNEFDFYNFDKEVDYKFLYVAKDFRMTEEELSYYEKTFPEFQGCGIVHEFIK
jgi:hypothetical protein